jgi:hypothetical protein
MTVLLDMILSLTRKVVPGLNSRLARLNIRLRFTVAFMQLDFVCMKAESPRIKGTFVANHYV